MPVRRRPRRQGYCFRQELVLALYETRNGLLEERQDERNRPDPEIHGVPVHRERWSHSDPGDFDYNRL